MSDINVKKAEIFDLVEQHGKLQGQFDAIEKQKAEKYQELNKVREAKGDEVPLKGELFDLIEQQASLQARAAEIEKQKAAKYGELNKLREETPSANNQQVAAQVQSSPADPVSQPK